MIPGHCCYNHQQPLSGPRDRGRLEGRTPPSGVAPTVKTSLAGDPVQPGVSPNIWAQGSPSKGGSQHHAPVLLPHRRMGPTTGKKTELGHPARPHCCTPVLPQAFRAPGEANQQPHGEAAALGDGTSLLGADSTGSCDCKELSQPSTGNWRSSPEAGMGRQAQPRDKDPTKPSIGSLEDTGPKGGRKEARSPELPTCSGRGRRGPGPGDAALVWPRWRPPALRQAPGAAPGGPRNRPALPRKHHPQHESSSGVSRPLGAPAEAHVKQSGVQRPEPERGSRTPEGRQAGWAVWLWPHGHPQ